MPRSKNSIYQWIAERQTLNSTYFKDNIKKIDAIIVFKMNNFCPELEIFLWKLKRAGMHLEFAPSTTDRNIIFGKVHAPDDVLIKYAKVYNIPLRKDQTVKFALPEVPCKILETPLNTPRPDPNHPVSKRAWKTISKKKPTELVFRERSVIVFAIMDYIHYGSNNFDVGIKQLMHKDIIIDAFPLHDGPWNWPKATDTPLNDRQLLAKYWGSIYMVLKQQPLYVVEKYFGYEVAVYFAWLGFYNKMLMYAAIMGVITFTCSILFVNVFNVDEIQAYCNNTGEYCAEHTSWRAMKFADHCSHTYVAYYNSNLGTFLYSCFIIIWCTLFSAMWNRELNIINAKWDKTDTEDFLLRFKWWLFSLKTVSDRFSIYKFYSQLINRIKLDNWVKKERPLLNKKNDKNGIYDQYFETRPSFIAKAKHVRRHKYTGEPELYVSIPERFVRYSLSILATISMLCIVVSSLALIVYVESVLKSLRISRIIITCIICFCSALFMTFSEKLVFDKAAVVLTKLELPKTDLAFEKSVMLKSCIYAFINNYGRIMYIAFLKGRFHIPSETLTQICQLPGCVFEVILMMFTVLLFKPFFDNFIEVQRPLFFVIARKIFRGTVNLDNKPRWEREYVANPLGSILGEVEEMVIQYGQVTCFAACCPLAPLFALMHNLIEIKVDSIKFLKYFKRPIERKQVSSIKIWFDILETLTYVIVVVNAFFMAYTCNLVYIVYDNLISYKKETFFDYYYKPRGDCYVGRQNDEQLVSRIRNAYQPSVALFLIILGFGVASVLSYIVPSMPRALREYLYHHERKQKK